MNKKVVLNKEGYQKLVDKIKTLQEELESLRDGKNIKGENLKENFDFETLKSEENRIYGKLSHYYEILSSAEIIESELKGENLIDLDDVVNARIAFSADDVEEYTFKIVSNATPNIHTEIPEVTINSPLGSSVYRKEVGSTVNYELNGEQIMVNIISKNKSLDVKVK